VRSVVDVIDRRRESAACFADGEVVAGAALMGPWPAEIEGTVELVDSDAAPPVASRREPRTCAGGGSCRSTDHAGSALGHAGRRFRSGRTPHYGGTERDGFEAFPVSRYGATFYGSGLVVELWERAPDEAA